MHRPNPRSNAPRRTWPNLGEALGGRNTALLGIALLAIALVPAASAGPAALSASTPVTASTGVFAWGAFDNATYQSEYLGAYADSLNLTSGNLSSSRAVVAELVADHALYGSFAVVNVTAPSSTTRSVVVSAISIANYSAIVEVVGTLPKVGTYSPGAPVPLANLSAVYYASIVEVQAYKAYSNYSLVNGTLALANEHVASWAAANDTWIAYHWPGYTNNANGTITVTSTTAAAVALSFVGQTFRANFTPALPLSKAPLSVGKTWNASTQATIVGWSAYASASAYSNGKTNVTAHNSGGTSLNTTTKLGFSFDVVASEQIVFPNGTTGTGYTIATSENGTAGGAYTLWDGLVILPAGSSPPVAAHLPTPYAVPDAPAATSGPVTEAVVSESGLPVATNAMVSSGTTLSTAPLTPAQAKAQITATATPVEPTTAVAPPVTSPPTLAGASGTPPSTSSPPPPTSNPPPATSNPTPTKPTTSHPSSGPSSLSGVVLVAALAAILGAFLVGEYALRRRRS